jgi:hypothetical protein
MHSFHSKTYLLFKKKKKNVSQNKNYFAVRAKSLYNQKSLIENIYIKDSIGSEEGH